MRYLIVGIVVVAGILLPQAELRQLPECHEKISSLRQVHVFFRHGERMPTSLYPTDPNKISDIKDGLGRVTKKGKRDQYEMGLQLRKRYEGFLTSDTNEVKARSSGRDRCLESIQTTLAALYKPSSSQAIKRDLEWQPVPVQTMPVDMDGMLYEDAICKNDDKAIEELRTTGEGKQVMDKYKDLMAKLYEKSGKKMNDWVSVRDLLDTLTIEKSIGLKIPDWADASTLKQMEECAKHTTLLNYKQDERIKFRAGLILKETSMHHQDVVNNSRKHKIYVYASHDVLVAAYLSAFKAFNGLAVPPSTAVITELHEESPGNFRVKMFFRNNTDTMAIEPVHVQGCKVEGCTVTEFSNIVSKFIPKDWRAECGEEALPVKLYDLF